MKKLLRNNAGFSLAELMVAVAVTGLLMAGVFGVLSTSILSFQHTADQGANVQLARSALSEITNELRNATEITVTATNPANLTYTVNSQPHQILLNAQSISIIKNGVATSIGEGRINSLQIVRDATNTRLFTVSVVVQSSATGAVATPVTTVVTTLN